MITADCMLLDLEQEKRHRAILRKCALKIAYRLASLVFGAWSGYLEATKRTRAIAARISGNHELSLLGNGLAQWRRRAEALAERKAKMRQSLGFLGNRLLAMAWGGWRSMMHQVAAMREKVLPILIL